MKSKELKTYNLPSEDLPISEIDAKPNFLFFVILVLGVFVIIFGRYYYYGLAMIVISMCAMTLMPKVTLISFYKDFLVLYNKADKNDCEIIYYNEVTSWHYSWNANHDYLSIELEDGNIEKIEAFSKTTFEYYMNRFLKDKHVKK